jgi:hypothetical protein
MTFFIIGANIEQDRERGAKRRRSPSGATSEQRVSN